MRTSAEKQFELVKLKAISWATIDYLAENPELPDSRDEDNMEDLYQHFKIQTEKYFQQRRLDRLQHGLSHFFEILIGRVDLYFTNYIRDKTGYEIELLEGLRNRVKIILERNEIRTQKEAYEISLLLNFYNKVFPLDGDIGKMNSVLTTYNEKMKPIILKRQKNYRMVVKVEEKDGVEITSITIHTGPKSK
jgi:hypothetical protein